MTGRELLEVVSQLEPEYNNPESCELPNGLYYSYERSTTAYHAIGGCDPKEAARLRSGYDSAGVRMHFGIYNGDFFILIETDTPELTLALVHYWDFGAAIRLAYP